jgi:hypothetical protein
LYVLFDVKDVVKSKEVMSFTGLINYSKLLHRELKMSVEKQSIFLIHLN